MFDVAVTRGWIPAVLALVVLSSGTAASNCTCSDTVGAKRWEFGAVDRDARSLDIGADGDRVPEVGNFPDVGCRPRDGGLCEPCLARRGGSAGWERHTGREVVCWHRSYDRHGARGEYDHAYIPPAGDPGWEDVGRTVQFSAESTLCDAHDCECLDGGDFTYYQTYFGVPEGLDLDSLRITIRDVDDGARITVFNSEHPGGVTPSGSYAFLGGGSTTDLADVLAEGANRVVITHVDDCCRRRRIAGVDVELNDRTLEWCE